MFISCFACTDSDQDHPNGPSLTKKNQESAIKIESDSSDDELNGPCSNTDAPSFTLLLNEANKIYLVRPLFELIIYVKL